MKKRSFSNWMRILHRDIGYFVIGLTMIYVISGIVLIYRPTDIFTVINEYTEQLEPGLSGSQVGRELKLRRFRITDTKGDIMYFRGGHYNSSTGVAEYRLEEYPKFIRKLIDFHIASSNEGIHWFSVTYSILLGYLALSSFWLYKPKSKVLRRGMIISAFGFILAVVLVLLT